MLKGGLETIKAEAKKDIDVLSFSQTSKPEDAHVEKIENNKMLKQCRVSFSFSRNDLMKTFWHFASF